MYDPTNPPVEGIPADPLPDDLPEGEAEKVEDEGGVLIVGPDNFESFEADDYQENEVPPELERGLADANTGRVKPGVLRSDPDHPDQKTNQAGYDNDA